jgi:hypothetical protein
MEASMKRLIPIIICAVMAVVVFALMTTCAHPGTGIPDPDTGIPADHFQVRFNASVAGFDWRFGIGPDTNNLLLDSGTINGEQTGFFHAQAGNYNIYEITPVGGGWSLQQNYNFIAGKQYEIEGNGAIASRITLLN